MFNLPVDWWQYQSDCGLSGLQMVPGNVLPLRSDPVPGPEHPLLPLGRSDGECVQILHLPHQQRQVGQRTGCQARNITRNQLQISSSVGLHSRGQSCHSQVEAGGRRRPCWRSARTEIPDILGP